MNKQDVIKKLGEMEFPYGIAEVTCDISRGNEVVYPNESILVLMVDSKNTDEGMNDDQIEFGKHWTICESVADFNEGIVYGMEEARKCYCTHYVSAFHEVRPFATDFEENKKYYPIN